ncbi:hypothetical protein DB88DRAFT_178032 [Papiliotrema laurentii]|uniref:Family A G protein-coupled receptor-like protein n=1 Tax=Papiliotrema laurentii TaxID=5418 RepID=A0AAD9L809_PAPLA|nr:hypothetical protein DB88DRAFT_178032 [Papiliotrema laurentii]
MGNNALQANPPVDVQQHITVRGSDWLWAVFAVMLFTDLCVMAWHFMVPRGQRVFHQLAIIILTTAAIAYFSMASNLGYTGVATEFGSEGFPAGVNRQIWYARYIDWTITTPALLLMLVLASGLPLSDIITLIFFDLVMIITGLIGALVESSYKWGFYAFGCAALFYIWWLLGGPARQSAGVLGAGYRRAFTSSAALLSFLWLLYPIAWGLADGANVISPDSEMIFYGILDLLAKPVYTILHLFMLSRLDLTALQLSSGKFTTSAVTGPHDVEKTGRHHYGTDAAVAGTAGAVGTGATTGTTHHTGKKNFFGRKGQYDATPGNTTNNTVGTHDAPNPPRPSEATAVSH